MLQKTKHAQPAEIAPNYRRGDINLTSTSGYKGAVSPCRGKRDELCRENKEDANIQLKTFFIIFLIITYWILNGPIEEKAQEPLLFWCTYTAPCEALLCKGINLNFSFSPVRLYWLLHRIKG